MPFTARTSAGDANENHQGSRYRASNDAAEQKPSRLEKHESDDPDDDQQRKTRGTGHFHRSEVDCDRRKLFAHMASFD
jgi:hypothetical protein